MVRTLSLFFLNILISYADNKFTIIYNLQYLYFYTTISSEELISFSFLEQLSLLKCKRTSTLIKSTYYRMNNLLISPKGFK